MAASVNNSAWLEWIARLMGGVSRQTQAAAFSPGRFYCLLDELPLHLIPQRHRHLLNARQNSEPLYLNPQCRLSPAADIPEEVARELASKFALQGTIAWVRDAGFLLPFWVGTELGSVLEALRPGERVPASVPAELKALLAAAKILVGESVAVASTREKPIEKVASLFQEKGYAPLSELIHPFHVAALRRYYRHQIRSGAIRLGDGQSPLRYCAHNEPVARFFHHQIANRLSAIAGEPLKPSYVYFASYLPGAELKKHLDRAQCEFSITCCLDFSPEPGITTPWPISLETPSGTVTVYQSLGDGLAYRGTRLPHYRGKLSEGQTSTSIFFHYVAQDFAGSLS